MQTEKYKKIAIFFIITSIILGSLKAHLLKQILSEKALDSLEIGIRYQLFHGLALLFLALMPEKFNSKLNQSLNLMTLGIFLFSFSIYLLSIQEITIPMNFLGPITPIGGFLLVLSWIMLFFTIKKTD